MERVQGIGMIHKVKKFIEKNSLLEQGDRVVAGVSGGADSVCLLLCLCQLQKMWNLRLTAVHVHHGLRGEEADQDAAFVGALCRKLKVPLHTQKTDVAGYAKKNRISEEEAGRILRYEIFREEAQGDKIAVAHHRDDQSETVLWNLFRGTGIRGMAGMSPLRQNVIRPLLCCERKEIEEYLTKQGQEYRIDSTNEEDGYTRNKIRNRILPYVEAEINPKASEHLASFAEQAREVDEFLEEMAMSWVALHQIWDTGRLGFSLDALRELRPVMGCRVLLNAMEQMAGSRKNIGQAHITAAWMLQEKKVGSRLNLPYQLIAERDYQHLWIQKKAELQNAEKSLPTVEYQIFPYLPEKKIPTFRYTKWFDYDKIKGNAVLRYRLEGDYFELAGGGRKTVKAYMIDKKIPAALRSKIPVLADGSHVLWIVGYRISEAYKVTKDTKTILQVRIGGGEDA